MTTASPTASQAQAYLDDPVLRSRPPVRDSEVLRWANRHRSYTVHRSASPAGPEFHVSVALGGHSRLIVGTAANGATPSDGSHYLSSVALTQQEAAEQLHWMRSTGLPIDRYLAETEDEPTAWMTHTCPACLRRFASLRRQPVADRETAHSRLTAHVSSTHPSEPPIRQLKAQCCSYRSSSGHFPPTACKSGPDCRFHGANHERV